EPLTWVKIGVPNRFVDGFTPLSSTISEMSYYSENGAFIRIDFYRAYYADDIVDFSFKIHQERIFTVNDVGQVTYRFIPGWFPEIKVENLTVKWEKSDWVYTNSDSSDDNYLIWTASLDFNEQIQVDVSYEKSKFPNIDLSKSYSDETVNVWETVFFIAMPILFILVVFVIVVIIAYNSSDEYYRHRGFSGTYFWGYHGIYYRRGVSSRGKQLPTYNPTIVNSGSGGRSSGGGGGCACACACACAGGGRAGCSRKDFCSTMDRFKSVVDKK
ncbi:MAG: hypothetical protein MJ072_03775, partial [Clostridia bacterium]|nr:hypothetical protein [Clostridia bacterium]